jgi:hypothetical protein
MDLLTVKALRGPNVWSKVSMLEARISVASWQHLGAGDVFAFRQRLAASLPGSSLERAVHHVEISHAEPGTALAEGLRDVALALQTLVSTPVSSGGIGPMSASG